MPSQETLDEGAETRSSRRVDLSEDPDTGAGSGRARHLQPMPAPSWVLLTWSGFAATFAAAVFGNAVGGGAPRAWSLAPRARTRVDALRWSFLAGMLGFPILYSLVFELIGRSDILVGIIAGLIHAPVAFLAARPREDRASAWRAAGIHFVYVVVFAFLYITP
jgi:hypothetical protein